MNLQNKNSMVLEHLSFFMVIFLYFSLDIGTDAAFCFSRGLLLPSRVLLKNFNTRAHTQTLMKFKGPVELGNTLYT